MAKNITISIHTGNAAFGDNEEAEAAELAAVLRRMADRVEVAGLFPAPKDSNGNIVGEVSTFEED